MSKAGAFKAAGLNIPLAYVQYQKSLKDFDGGEPISNEAHLELPCTVLIPASLERVISEVNAPKLRCRLLAEATNGPTPDQADKIVEGRDEVLSKLFAILDKAKDSVEYQKRKFKFSRRLAALTLGIQRVADAKAARGLFP